MVEQKNLVRQNFTPADLGENKAQVLAERYSSVFGMETEYVPNFVEDEDRLKDLLIPMRFRQRRPNSYREEIVEEMVILLGAVDNNKSRQLCHRVFTQAKELIYIDSGNGEYTGQVVCGVRRSGKTYYPPIGVVYPDVLEDTDKFPTELSCAEASVSAPQSMAANITAATAVVGTMLQIKPVMHVDNEGHLIKVDTARGRKASLNALVDKVGELGENPAEQTMFISNSDCAEDAQYVADEIKKRYGTKEIIINSIGPVIGAHTGPGCVALFFMGKHR